MPCSSSSNRKSYRYLITNTEEEASHRILIVLALPKSQLIMEANQTRRNPLSDCTNIPSSSYSVPLKSHKTNPSSSLLNKPATKFTNLDNTPNPISPSSPIPPTPSLKTPTLHGTGDVEDVVDVEASEPISVVYSRSRRPNKRRIDKGKGVAVPVSRTPNLKISDSGKKNDEFEGANLPKAKALTAPPRKKQRAMSSEKDVFKDPKLQAFIEERKAYFKEIDDFELQVEVESGDE